MSTATLPTLTSKFLLIGVDFYQPAPCPDHDFKGTNLEGCVEDVTALDEYLQNTLHIPSNQITKLTSSKPSNGGTEPAEAPEIRATTANIKSALEAILKECKNGDQVLIHYSGHGGRAPTLWPKVKGIKAYDESLIPCDIRCGGNLLRDVNLGLLLQQMTKKGLMVTIVLDCCYSGGATRGDDEKEGTPRAFEEFRDLPLDMMKPPSEVQVDPNSVNNVASEHEIAAMLRERQLYDLFAACQANEKALEKDRRGVLTITMLRVLKSAGASLPTNGKLFRQIMSQLKSLPKKVQQNPQFSGNKRRVFLQTEEKPDIASIPVTEEQSYGARYIRLEAGSVMGMVKDAEFLVFPWEATEFTESCAVAKLRVYRARELFCYAKEIAEPIKSTVKYSDGYQAVQCHYPVNSKIKVRLVGSLAKNEIAKNEIMKSGFATVAEAQDNLVNYTICSTSDGSSTPDGNHIPQYILQDGIHQPIPNVPKFLDLASLLTGVYQLAKYSTLKAVQNTKWTADCLSTLQFDFDLADQHVSGSSDTYIFAEGSSFDFRFKNNSQEALYLVILNFRPLYEIFQVYPVDSANCGWVDTDSDIVDPPFRRITQKIRHKTPVIEDEFKIFVSTKPLDFSFMQQPNIEASNQDKAESRETIRGENGILEIWDRSSDLFRGSDSEAVDWDTRTIRIVTRKTLPENARR